jgi:hypothetical protein
MLNRKVAKLCALTLCNLSMEVNGEAIMAKEGAILALVVLLGIKGQSLLPICVQALYNMTSAYDHFKGIERIIKALLNMSSVGFDYSDFLVKALVNCARYSWLRLRIIEDGGINSLHTLLPNLPSAENRSELVFNMLTALHSLSESSGCRSEMLLKGTVELLNSLLAYSDEKDKLLIIKILHNFLQSPLTLSLSAFETSTLITYHITINTSFVSTIQYCSACFHIITREKLRGLRHLASPIISAMSILLKSEDAITQFFAISSAGNLFFENICDDNQKIEELVQYFVESGNGIIDSAAKQALALALAKLSQETKYVEVIEKLSLLNVVLVLLMDLREAHRDSLLLQESCCIAICRLSLRMKDEIREDGKHKIASIFLDMLHTNDQFVLCSTISGIRALGSSGLCPKQFLADKTLLPTIATIIARFNHELELCRYGCAVLAVFSYDLSAHDILADKKILTVLFANINSEDPITRELVANTVCNLSMHAIACQTMISMNVVEVLGQLSSSTSETILDLCAKSLCNLTCFPELHKLVINNHVLEILLMISLVRTVSSQTKCNCAKALLNLITNDNLSFITASGAVRIFASLSTIPFPPVQSVCSKGFHILTSNSLRRSEMVKVRTVISSLFHMIKSASTTMSSNVKIRLGMAVINLLSCKSSNTEAISAGALSCLKIIVTMEFEELREAVARIILNLSLDEKFHNVLIREPIVPILILILQKHLTPVSFAVAINGLSCLSQIPLFKKILLRDLALEALIGMIIGGKVADSSICYEICRTWTHLSYSVEQAEPIIRSGRLGLALEIMHGSGLSNLSDIQTLIILLVRNLSEAVKARIYIVEQDIFRLLVKILLDDSEKAIKHDPKSVTTTTSSSSSSSSDVPPSSPQLHQHWTGIKSLGYAAMIKIVFNLCQVPGLHSLLVAQGLMQLFQYICLPLQYSYNEQLQQVASSEPSLQQQQPDANNNENEDVLGESSLSLGGGSLYSSDFTTSPNGSVKSLRSGVDNPLSAKLPSSQRDARMTINSSSFHSPSSKHHHRQDRKFQSFSIQTNHENDDDNDSVGSDKRSKGEVGSINSRNLMDFRKKSTFRLFFTSEQVDFISSSLRLLAHSSSCHEAMVAGEVMAIFKSLIFSEITENSKREISETLSLISQSKSCREELVNQGACELLIALSITSDANTQAHCATALAYLSEITKVHKGVVASLLLLSLSLEDPSNRGGPGGSLTSAFNQDDLLSATLIQNRGGREALANQNPSFSATAKDLMNQLKSQGVVSANAVVTNGNVVLPGGATPSSADLTAVVASLAAAANGGKGGGNSGSTASQTLTTLLRDLMIDKKRFDSYLEALQKNNQENLTSNNFVPKTPKKILAETPSHSRLNGLLAGGIGGGGGSVKAGRSGSEFGNRFISSIPSLELHLTAPYTRLAVSSFHQTLLVNEEGSLLKTNFDEFIYNAPESSEGYRPQFAGLSRKRLSDLPLPGIPPDRDLEPPNRHDELLKIPVNQDPLPKDRRPPHYLDHHKSTISGDIALGNSTDLRSDSKGNIEKSGDGVHIASTSNDSLGNSPSASRRVGGKDVKSSSSSGQRSGSAGEKLGKASNDILGKKNALDPRSPLLQSNNLFKNSNTNGKMLSSLKPEGKIAVRSGVKSLPKITGSLAGGHSIHSNRADMNSHVISEEAEDEASQGSANPKRKSGVHR